MVSLAQVIHVIPDGPVGVAGQPTGELLEAYEEVWRVMELLRLIVGSLHWWDSTSSGSVASALPLRERLLFSNAEEALIWVGGDANMNGVAAGSWSDGFYAIVRAADFDALLKAILTEDFGAEDYCGLHRGRADCRDLGISLHFDDRGVLCCTLD